MLCKRLALLRIEQAGPIIKGKGNFPQPFHSCGLVPLNITFYPDPCNSLRGEAFDSVWHLTEKARNALILFDPCFFKRVYIVPCVSTGQGELISKETRFESRQWKCLTFAWISVRQEKEVCCLSASFILLSDQPITNKAAYGNEQIHWVCFSGPRLKEIPRTSMKKSECRWL